MIGSNNFNSGHSVVNSVHIEINDRQSLLAEIAALKLEVTRLTMENEGLKDTVKTLSAEHRESQLALQLMQQFTPTPSPTPVVQVVHAVVTPSPVVQYAPVQPVPAPVLPTITSTLSLKQRLLSFRHVHRLDHVDQYYVHTIFTAQDGKFYTSGTEGIRLWNSEYVLDRIISKPDNNQDPALHIAENSCYYILFEGGIRGSYFRILNKFNHMQLTELCCSNLPIVDVAFNENFAILSSGDIVHVLDLETFKRREIPAVGGAICLGLTQDNLLFYKHNGFDSHKWIWYDLNTHTQVYGKSLNIIDRPKKCLNVGNVAYISLDKKQNGPIYVVDNKSFLILAELEGHLSTVQHLVHDKILNVLFTFGDECIKMFDLDKRALVNSFRYHPDTLCLRIGIWNGKLAVLNNKKSIDFYEY